MKYFLPTIALSAIVVTSVAQAEGCNKNRSEKKLDRLTEVLSLDESQRSQVSIIMQDTRSQIDAIKADRDTALGSVLSEEQLAKLQAFESKRGKPKR